MTVWITLAYQLIKRAMKNEALWTWLEAMVMEASSQDSLSGSEKRTWVETRLAAIPDPYRAYLSGAATWLVNLAIEAMVAKLKVSKA
jgi:hypothetical protein